MWIEISCVIAKSYMYRKQMIIGVVVVVLSWYGMMVVHEAGHCFGAVITGGKIERVVIPIVGFSRTDVSASAQPLIVIWGGPIFGAVTPVILLIWFKHTSQQVRQILRYFIGFCLIANGAYIGIGAILRAGDCEEMLKYGSPMWLLVVFGLISSVAGLFVWHRMGSIREWFATG